MGVENATELGGQLNPTDPPTDNKVSVEQKALKHDYMNIYGDIELISADELAANVTLATEMVDFFAKFGFYNYSSEWALLELIVEFLASDKFVLHEDQYYRVRAKAPFVWYHYAPADLCPYDKVHMKIIVQNSLSFFLTFFFIVSHVSVKLFVRQVVDFSDFFTSGWSLDALILA